MANLFDYITWRGDLSFKSSSFNNVDNLILSRLAFLPFEGVVSSSFEQRISLAEAGETLLAEPLELREYNLKDDRKLIEAAAQSRRFRNMRLSGYVNAVDSSAEKQFCALCIEPGDGALYVAFCGTDKSLVGWKEDLNMSFMTEIPAQRQAVAYLEQAAEYFSGRLRLGGHSKGGNLAVYSGAFCASAVQARIMKIYNNDGPGFHGEVLDRPVFKEILGRISTFVPQTSVVGMLLEHEEEYIIVKSTETGLFQHNLYSWQVLGKDLVCLTAVSNSSKFIDHTLKDWIASMNPERRGEFVEALYSVVAATGVRTFDEFAADWYKNALSVGKTLYNMEPKMRRMIRKTIWSIIKAGRNNLSIFSPIFGEKE